MKNITSTAKALQYLYSISLNTSNLKFRGQANSGWPLTPTIYRYSDFKRYQAIIHERDLLKTRPLNSTPPLTHTSYEVEWLMVCQHYEVPTRLLDWTSDILIALFFACSDKGEADKDGALFICNQDNYPQFNLYHEKLIQEQELVFINTYIVNPRMRFQAGSFMLWGASPLNDKSKESYDLWEYHIQNNSEGFLKKLIIPKNFKNKILNELKLIYAISDDTVRLKNGYLEKTFSKQFKALKEQLRLTTFYQTNSDELTLEEKQKARTFFKIDCENWLGGCISLSKY